MSQFIEQLESRQYFSTSLSNPTYLDIQPTDAAVVGQLNKAQNEKVYLIRVMKAGEINLRLEGLTGDATLQFISDKNHNNRLDKGEVVQQSAKNLAADESIRRTMTAGTYQVRVVQVDANSITNYSLRYSTSPFVSVDLQDRTGDDTGSAREFSIPKGSNRTVNEYVGGSDSADVFRLDVTALTKYDIRLSGLTKDANVTLSDAAGNVLATTVGAPASKKLIAGKLAAGTYFLTVTAVAAPTGYSLRVVGSAYRSSDVDLTTRRVSLASKFSTVPIPAILK